MRFKNNQKRDEKYPLITVGALILNKKNQILLLKSSKWKGKLGIPSGKLNYGENTINGLKREIREETNLIVYNIKFLLIQEIIEPKDFFKNSHFVSINHVCKTKNSNVKLNHEAQSYKWATAEDALKLNLNKSTEELIQYHLELKNRDKIIIKDLEIDCIVGIRKKERREKQKIYVTAEIYTDTKKAAKTKNIKDAMNYSSIIKNIKKLIINKKYLLLESMAEDISNIFLKNKNVTMVKVLIKKPKAIGKGRYAGVEIMRGS